MGRIGIVGLVPDAWNRDSVTTRHYVHAELARTFPSIWIEPRPSLLAVLRGARGTARRMERPTPAGLDLLQTFPRFPRAYRPAALVHALDRALLRRCREQLQARGADRMVLYVWRPEFLPLVREGMADAVCYHIDDEYSFSPVELPPNPDELEMIRRADQVFVHSPELMRKKGGLNPHTAMFPNGVEFGRFAEPAAEPGDLAAVPRPRIGYLGVLKQQLDWTLLHSLAAARPEWSFVFVGPSGFLGNQTAQFEATRRLPNCHFLGPRAAAQLPAYTQAFDVCAMPYVVDDYTRYILPLKLHEYLAAGRPVVSTPIPAVESMDSVVRVAAGTAAWVAAIEAELAPARQSGVAAAARRHFAAGFDWTMISRSAVVAIEQAVHRRERSADRPTKRSAAAIS